MFQRVFLEEDSETEHGRVERQGGRGIRAVSQDRVASRLEEEPAFWPLLQDVPRCLQPYAAGIAAGRHGTRPWLGFDLDPKAGAGDRVMMVRRPYEATTNPNRP